MRFRMAGALLALSAALLLAACGGGDEGPAAAKIACSLLTQEEASEVLGEPAADTGSQAVGPFSSCTYKPVGQSSRLKLIIVLVRGGVSQDEFRRVIESGGGPLGEKPQEVSGLGDQAYSQAGVLIVRKGDFELQMSVVDSDLDEPALLEKAKQVARKAVGRLP